MEETPDGGHVEKTRKALRLALQNAIGPSVWFDSPRRLAARIEVQLSEAEVQKLAPLLRWSRSSNGNMFALLRRLADVNSILGSDPPVLPQVLTNPPNVLIDLCFGDGSTGRLSYTKERKQSLKISLP